MPEQRRHKPALSARQHSAYCSQKPAVSSYIAVPSSTTAAVLAQVAAHWHVRWLNCRRWFCSLHPDPYTQNISIETLVDLVRSDHHLASKSYRHHRDNFVLLHRTISSSLSTQTQQVLHRLVRRSAVDAVASNAVHAQGCGSCRCSPARTQHRISVSQAMSAVYV